MSIGNTEWGLRPFSQHSRELMLCVLPSLSLATKTIVAMVFAGLCSAFCTGIVSCVLTAALNQRCIEAAEVCKAYRCMVCTDPAEALT